MLNFSRIRLRQSGAALLLLMLAIILIFTVILLGSFDSESKRIRLEQRTQDSLSRAKETLIAYAVTHHDLLNPGVFARLPCPDANPLINAEGQQDPTCGPSYASAVGLFPWNSLGIEALRDGYGECLWYAVSGHYKVQPGGVTSMTNQDSPGQLAFYAADGNTLLAPDTPDDRTIAAIFAPGPPLPGQDRGSAANTQCGGDYNAADFLEAAGLANNAVFNNANYAVDRIARGDESSGGIINDRVITVSKAELWNAIQNRNYSNLTPPGVARYPADIFSQFISQLANCIANYGLNRGGGDLRLPWAMPVDRIAAPPAAADPLVNWFYSNEANYDDLANTYGGRFPLSIQASANTLGGGNNLFVAANCAIFNVPPYQNLWNHWKDHVFYVVAEARAPNSATPSQPCGGAPNRCLSVNGVGNYAAIVMFAGIPLAGQSRDGPQEPIDQKAFAINYLDAGNAVLLGAENTGGNGSGNYQNIPFGPNFNDILICIDENLNVVNC